MQVCMLSSLCGPRASVSMYVRMYVDVAWTEGYLAQNLYWNNFGQIVTKRVLDTRIDKRKVVFENF